jgi:hypothetical protein
MLGQKFTYQGPLEEFTGGVSDLGSSIAGGLADLGKNLGKVGEKVGQTGKKGFNSDNRYNIRKWNRQDYLNARIGGFKDLMAAAQTRDRSSVVPALRGIASIVYGQGVGGSTSTRGDQPGIDVGAGGSQAQESAGTSVNARSAPNDIYYSADSRAQQNQIASYERAVLAQQEADQRFLDQRNMLASKFLDQRKLQKAAAQRLASFSSTTSYGSKLGLTNGPGAAAYSTILGG